jgi:hypothetical protein
VPSYATPHISDSQLRAAHSPYPRTSYPHSQYPLNFRCRAKLGLTQSRSYVELLPVQNRPILSLSPQCSQRHEHYELYQYATRDRERQGCTGSGSNKARRLNSWAQNYVEGFGYGPIDDQPKLEKTSSSTPTTGYIDTRHAELETSKHLDFVMPNVGITAIVASLVGCT